MDEPTRRASFSRSGSEDVTKALCSRSRSSTSPSRSRWPRRGEVGERRRVLKLSVKLDRRRVGARSSAPSSAGLIRCGAR